MRANDNVSLEVARGEVHAVLGENGAGKTTLVNILYGLYHPDSGRIRWGGREVSIGSPREALDLGIGMVHQHFMLVPTLTVLDNLLLILPETGQIPNRGRLRKRLQELSARFGLNIDLNARVGALSLGERQRVEILKALSRNAQLLILDEPTSVLAPGEVRSLWETLGYLQRDGMGVVLITHKLAEARAVANRITVLRGGRVVGCWQPDAVSDAELITAIVGDASMVRENGERTPRQSPTEGDIPVVDLLNVSTSDERVNLRGVNLQLYRGEILGIAGIDGNGQSSLARAIAGIQQVSGGLLRRNRKLRVGFVPAERIGTGLVGSFAVTENMLLRNLAASTWFRGAFLHVIRWRIVRDTAGQVIRDFSVRGHPTQQVRELSGGNQQKLVVGREVGRGLDLLIVEQPTQGLDVAASATIIDLMKRQARENNIPVVWISSNLDELLGHADRVVVLFDGRIVGEVPPGQESLAQVGRLMVGGE